MVIPAHNLKVEPYTANFVLNDVPQMVCRLLLKVQLQQKSNLGTVHTNRKEIRFDFSSKVNAPSASKFADKHNLDTCSHTE